MNSINNILSITRKDILVMSKDWGTLVQLFLLPLIFIFIFGGLWSVAAAGDDEESFLPLPLVNLDPSGETAQKFIDNINKAGGLKTEEYEEVQAQVLFDGEEIERLLTIPAGFSDAVLAHEPATVHLLMTGANAEEDQSVFLVVEGVARNMGLEAQILASLEQMGDMSAASAGDLQVFTDDRALSQAQSQFERAETTPLIAVLEKLPDVLGEEAEERLNATQIAVPGMTVLFIFLTAQVTASSIYDEKKVGSFRRLLAAPIRQSSLLSGKMLPNFLTVLVQVIVIWAVAIFIFPLIGLESLDLGDAPVALALLVLTVAVCSTALGVFIAGIARTEAQVGGISQAILWIMAFLGGAIIPFILFGDAMSTIGQFIPHYWAVTGFNDLLIRGKGLADITLNLVVLLGFSLLFFVVGLWRFDYD
jgi:ABC-2 type transport system permease protein